MEERKERTAMFGRLTPDGFTAGRILKMSDIRRCPHLILDPAHYREDGSCYCEEGISGSEPMSEGWRAERRKLSQQNSCYEAMAYEGTECVCGAHLPEYLPGGAFPETPEA